MKYLLDFILQRKLNSNLIFENYKKILKIMSEIKGQAPALH